MSREAMRSHMTVPLHLETTLTLLTKARSTLTEALTDNKANEKVHPDCDCPLCLTRLNNLRNAAKAALASTEEAMQIMASHEKTDMHPADLPEEITYVYDEAEIGLRIVANNECDLTDAKFHLDEASDSLNEMIEMLTDHG